VQVLADEHGKVVHLFERECSVQRRHQKVIEEAPCPVVDAALRSAMGAAAVRLARAGGYANAGTVEFLLDEEGSFAFLEVNARLQVEHPVTEMVTGLDLVELQLRIAAGEPLPLTQDDVQLNGHAIEVRVIAEDALAGFLPSSGTIEWFEVPYFARTDSGVQPGSTVPPEYDSLLAKIISHEDTREGSIRILAHALEEVQLEGVANNVDLLLSTIEHPAFGEGDLHTGFFDEHRILEEVASLPPPVLAAACALDFVVGNATDDPWRGPAAWRLGRIDQPASWRRGGRLFTATLRAPLDGPGVEVIVGVDRLRVRALAEDEGARRRFSVNGQTLTVWDHHDWLVIEFDNRSYRLQRARPLSIADTLSAGARHGGTGRLTAPMPGRIVKITVHQGEQVRPNQPLVVLEAMKMEHVVEAPHAGVVNKLCVEVGQQVTAGALLLQLEE